MRIGYVVKRYPRFSETFIVGEILAHEAAGWDVEVFALRPPTDTHFQDMLARVRAPVTYLTPDRPKAREVWEALAATLELDPPASAWPALAAATHLEAYQACRLAMEVRRRRIDHLHAHFASSQAEVARLAARLVGVPYTVTAHAKDIFHESVDRAALAAKLEDAAEVITVSDFNARYLKRIAPAARIRRVYNGLDLEEFSFHRTQEREPLVLAVGRFVEKKGFGDLIKACSRLRDAGVHFQCQIVGKGDLEPALRASISSRGLDGVVHLVGPWPRQTLRQLYRRAALLVAPCVQAGDGDRDGMPTVLLEAMASGTPCIATPVTGIPELIENRQTGLLVAERDPEALAATIEEALGDVRLRQRVATAARQRIERDFDASESAARLREAFRRAGQSTRLEESAA